MLWIFFIDAERDNNLNMYKKPKLLFFFCLILVFMLAHTPKTFAVIHEGAEVKTESGGLVTKIAPGEFLPVSVKLTNFGGGRRVDVSIDYSILDDSGNVITTESETVAVETTASYVKFIQVPYSAVPGTHTAQSSIVYQGQLVPAIATYQFSVERKIAGIFTSQFILYAIIALSIGIVFAIMSRLLIKKRRARRLTPHDYSNVPKEKRIFYEIIGDTIMQMRYRVGDEAMEIAKNIRNLVIDERDGKVLEIKDSPEKIIALLVLQYEKNLGEKVSFALRKPDKEAKENLDTVNKNLVVVRKYFQ